MKRITIWRIYKKKYHAEPFSGVGGLYDAGRWHSKGTFISYASTDPSLALLEILVRIHKYQRLKMLYEIASMDIPGNQFERLDISTLPDTWRKLPYRKEIQSIGDSWIAGCSAFALLVPSAVMPLRDNVLINPSHPKYKAAAKTVKIIPLPVDQRLFRPK